MPSPSQPFNGQTEPTTLNRILSGVTRMRPLPGNVSSLLRALDSPQSDASKIASLLSLDQALTAYVLRVANSAHLGYGLSCSSVREAVMRLGFQRIRMLVLSTAASGPLAKRMSGYRLGEGVLWSHSIATGSIAHWLSRELGYHDPEEAYVAGLLHDMGKLVLDQFVQVDYQRVVEILYQHRMHLWQVEEHLFGIDHAGVGGLMAEQWQFPVVLQDAIRYHHAPSLARKHHDLAAVVNLANALTPKDDPKLAEMVGHPVHPQAVQILRLDPKVIEELRTETRAILKDYEVRQPLSYG